MPNDLLAPQPEQRTLRVTFKGPWYPSGVSVAKVVRAALAEAFPDVKFTIRYRTSQTYVHPSWVALTWSAGPSDTDVAAAIGGPLRQYSRPRRS
jgi:hypothetical protein